MRVKGDPIIFVCLLAAATATAFAVDATSSAACTLFNLSTMNLVMIFPRLMIRNETKTVSPTNGKFVFLFSFIFYFCRRFIELDALNANFFWKLLLKMVKLRSRQIGSVCHNVSYDK